VADRRRRPAAVQLRSWSSVCGGPAPRHRRRGRCGSDGRRPGHGHRDVCGRGARLRQERHDHDSGRVRGDAHPPRLDRCGQGRDRRRGRRRRDRRPKRRRRAGRALRAPRGAGGLGPPGLPRSRLALAGTHPSATGRRARPGARRSGAAGRGRAGPGCTPGSRRVAGAGRSSGRSGYEPASGCKRATVSRCASCTS
jgi:hypothetical protein